MSVEYGFLASLAVTLVLLGAAVVTGLRARRRRHLTFVALALVGLVVTIVLAEALGERYDLAATEPVRSIHLAIAKTSALAFALPLASGIATLRNPARRRLHRWCAIAALSAALAAVATGTWMMLLAQPLGAG